MVNSIPSLVVLPSGRLLTLNSLHNQSFHLEIPSTSHTTATKVQDM